MSRFPNARQLFSLSALCFSRLRILVSIWGNGSDQGTGLVHEITGSSCRRPVPPSAGSALCPPALNRLRSRRQRPERAHSRACQVQRRLGLGREGGEDRHGYPWVRRDFPSWWDASAAEGDPTGTPRGCSASDPVSLHWAARVHLPPSCRRQVHARGLSGFESTSAGQKGGASGPGFALGGLAGTAGRRRPGAVGTKALTRPPIAHPVTARERDLLPTPKR